MIKYLRLAVSVVVAIGIVFAFLFKLTALYIPLAILSLIVAVYSVISIGKPKNIEELGQILAPAAMSLMLFMIFVLSIIHRL